MPYPIYVSGSTEHPRSEISPNLERVTVTTGRRAWICRHIPLKGCEGQGGWGRPETVRGKQYARK